MNAGVYDFIIIGSGIGGGACVSELAQTGASLLILERGFQLKAEKENWDPSAMFVKRRYSCEDVFYDKDGKAFVPRMYYCIGGNSKVFGGSAFRFRKEDFEEQKFPNGTSIAWPVRYDELAPYYARAEQTMHVCGKKGEDITEPPREEYPHAARAHEPYIEKLSDNLCKEGLHPFHLPIAINTERCRKGSACDGYPCRIKAKYDAEVSFITPALDAHSNVELWTDAYVETLYTTSHAHKTSISSLKVIRNNKAVEVKGRTIVLAAGAINSALLLLRSKNAQHENGLANSSDQVGRNYMSHINTVIIAGHFFKKNPTVFQKTLAVNDYYLQRSQNGSFLGSIQMRGKILPENLETHAQYFLRTFRKYISSHSTAFWAMTEDYPLRENRVYIDERGHVCLTKNYVNMDAHKEMIETFTRVLKRIGYHWVYADTRTINSVQHQCGTIRMGTDARTSPLDKWCNAYDIDNLYVVDASVFPSSAALNPALTVAANAMRVGDHLKTKWKKRQL